MPNAATVTLDLSSNSTSVLEHFRKQEIIEDSSTYLLFPKHGHFLMRIEIRMTIICLVFGTWGFAVGFQFNKYCPEVLPSKCFCNKALTSVNCEGLQLTDIPAGIPKTVEKLYLTHNYIDTLKSSRFGVLPNLKELYLQNNKIMKLQMHTFHAQYTPNLNLLRLDNNVIASLEKWSFYNLTVLEHVYVGNNYIKQIDENAFFKCTSITFVILDSNKLTRIPPLGTLQGLQSLYIQANGINNATFPAEYRNLTQLKNIGLSNNFIRILGNETFEALSTTTVIKLELSRNKIDNISRHAFAPLHMIQSLKLGRNPITAPVLESALVGLQGKPLRSLNIANLTLGGFIPNATFQLLRNTTINTLLMANNRIQHIPDRAFADLENLQLLDLSSSGITSVADTAFDGLKTLTNLKLNDNVLDDVPNHMPTTLQLLYLNGNRIASLPDDIFSNLNNLQRLYLGGNNIVTLYQSSFNGLVNLKTLHLAQNKISTLPGKVFQPFTRLISLELNRNNIKSISDPSSLFDSMKALQNLNLADNALGIMPTTLFNQLSSLQYLHLENNNIGLAMEHDREGQLFAGLHKLQTIDLTNNQIKLIYDSSFRDLNTLQSLTLRQNRLSAWSPHLFNKMVKLKTLDLSHNMIALVNSTSLQDLGNLMSLNLTENPFACTCDLRWFRDWVNTTDIAIPGLTSYVCNSPVAWRGKKLLSFDRTKINCLFFTLPVLLTVVGVAVFVVIIIIICLYRKRWFIRLRCHRMCRRVRRKVQKAPINYEPVPGTGNTFDAYLSCAEDDWGWVLDNILMGIDNGKLMNVDFGGEHKLYFDRRDSEPGKSNIGNIVDNMEASRTVIIILSNNYVSDPRYAFELEFVIMLKAKGVIEDFIIVASEYLKVKRVPKALHPMMASERYLQWEDKDDAVQTIKGKLKDFLYKREYP
ncbi:Toll-like receptor 3 [Mizuhopecten yessoensis]|uniref:Toll-like receptor 3 n=1 Tax=Mizuhopecten yessoensis TaxID=6573 RepID=A0A210PT07_MIZYE|nr:Toll-like receptor 3 [Mizuhopecten yessoensis]